MRVEGLLYSGNHPLAHQQAADEQPEHSYSQQMENCLLALCRSLGTPLPLWMKKNSRELGAFRQTTFTAEQFLEPVRFDRFVLRLL